MNKAYSLFRLKKYEEAIIIYDYSIKINPSQALIYVYKGKSLYLLQKYDEAISCYNKAIELDSHLTETKFLTTHIRNLKLFLNNKDILLINEKIEIMHFKAESFVNFFSELNKK